jgi:hypothetical protein
MQKPLRRDKFPLRGSMTGTFLKAMFMAFFLKVGDFQELEHDIVEYQFIAK